MCNPCLKRRIAWNAWARKQASECGRPEGADAAGAKGSSQAVDNLVLAPHAGAGRDPSSPERSARFHPEHAPLHPGHFAFPHPASTLAPALMGVQHFDSAPGGQHAAGPVHMSQRIGTATYASYYPAVWVSSHPSHPQESHQHGSWPPIAAHPVAYPAPGMQQHMALPAPPPQPPAHKGHPELLSRLHTVLGVRASAATARPHGRQAPSNPCPHHPCHHPHSNTV